MFRFLKGLFGKNEEETLTLAVEDVDGWLEAREGELEERLKAQTGETRETVVASLQDLRGVLAVLGDAEGREDIPSRLKTVTDRSLPSFLAAMEQQIARPLPEDPDGFYAAAADLITGILKVQRGQGRYLAGAFPEEMKEFRQVTSAIGNAVNDLTAVVKEAQAAQKQIDAARDALRTFQAAQIDIVRAGERAVDLKTEITAAEQDLQEKTAALQNLKNGDAYREAARSEEEAKTCLDRREEAERAVQNLGAQAARIIRKAERVAARAGGKEEAKMLQACIRVLDQPVSAGAGEVEAALAPVIRTVRGQIERGDLPLKSKEDRTLFSEGGKIEGAFTDAFAHLAAMRREEEEALARARSYTALREAADLEQEIEDLKAGTEADRAAQAEATEQVAAETERIPERARRLRDALAPIAGVPVTLEGEGFTIAAETRT
ncbi:hypothetical protein E2N92_10850 [Methanofollis formosanus]|uniref:Cell surface protein n=1 Tax=Methanofollis formosanus TaxID=299308 RepID=A0A8G1A3H4_9EURY|nr:hypothetical protein [Methanofollis formosanus]QYZ79885.1 hypothetical protein E2N92_10850 [Methanofollis formosanus]